MRATCTLLVWAILALSGAAFAADALPTGPIGSAAALDDALALLGKSPGTVVAEADGRPVTIDDVIEEIRALPRVNAEAPFPVLFREAATLVIDRKLLAAKAEAAGLAANPAVRQRIETARDRLLGETLIQRSLAPNLLEPAVWSSYEASPISKAEVVEVQLRVIAADTQADAQDLIRKINGGADFAELARASSRDPSAARGGLLDYHWRDSLAPELAAVGFAMNVGGMTAYPVHSGGSWFVVRCEARRVRPPLTFPEARRTAERDIMKTGAADLRGLAIRQSNITYYGLEGKSAAPANP